jgi:hypothetical protein
MGVFLIVLLAPVLYTFFVALYKDPVVPDLLKAGAENTKNFFAGYLGSGRRLLSGERAKQS